MRKKERKDNAKDIGRWTQQEHQRFMQGVISHGKNWKMVEQVVGTRTASQVRSHAQKFFNRLDREQKRIEKMSQKSVQPTICKVSHKTEASLEDDQETPEQLFKLVRKNSRQDKSVNVSNFLTSLKEQTHTLAQNIAQKQKLSDSEPPLELAKLQRRNSQLRCVTNIVESYSNISDVDDKDESFFINLMYKCMLGQQEVSEVH